MPMAIRSRRLLAHVCGCGESRLQGRVRGMDRTSRATIRRSRQASRAPIAPTPTERGEMVAGAEEWGGVGGTAPRHQVPPRSLRVPPGGRRRRRGAVDGIEQVEPIHGEEPAGRVRRDRSGHELDTAPGARATRFRRGSVGDHTRHAHHASRQRRGSRRPARSGVDRANPRRDRPVRTSGTRTACRAHPARGDQRRARRLEQGGALRSRSET